jgi:hypothetical protein
MFNQIKETNKPFPYQTFSIALCSIGVTVFTIFFPNLTHVYGSYKSDIGIVQYLSLPFQHGYDNPSALAHLFTCMIILTLIGATCEKLLGPNRFFVFNCIIIFIYAASHKLFGMIGHGLTPLLFAYVPVIAYGLNEGRLIKTRSMYDEYYKTLWALILVILILIPIMLSIIPIYFDSDASFSQQVIYGNILHLILLITGAIFIARWKETVRHRLLYFAKKKKFPPYRWEKFTPYLALSYPILLLIILIADK